MTQEEPLRTYDTPAKEPREHRVPMHREAQPPPPRRRSGGPRPELPRTPPGEDVPDPNPSRQTRLEAPGAAPEAETRAAPGVAAAPSPSSLVLVKNVALQSVAANQAASSTGEPSVATNGTTILYTGNWYAAVSTDGGATFQFIDPANAFPDPPGLVFCCDQVAHYIPQIDTFVWLLQYINAANQNDSNIQRLAFATTAQVAAGTWRTFDISPADLSLPAGLLDFPDLAVGENMLYVTTNAFPMTGGVRAALIRIPLAGIQAGPIKPQHIISSQNLSLRVAQHSGTRAWFASHNTTSRLRVFHWDEAAVQPAFNDLTVATWTEGPSVSTTPDGFNWLGKSDGRIVGATVRGTELWFAWNSNAGGANGRPNPFAQVARIDTATMTVLDNINIWNKRYAIAYPALVSNARGDVGVTYAYGGGSRPPSHAVGILTGQARSRTTATGQFGPQRQRWGDYLTVRRHRPNDKLFAATGYTLANGTGQNDGLPRFVLYGRAADV